MSKGLFITFEGNDRNGRATASKLIYEKLKETGCPVLYIGEPGSIDIAEQIHSIILDPADTAMDERCEALLYAANHRQHLIEKVLSVLKEGKVVLCDRSVDSSLVYQGIIRGTGAREVLAINQLAVEGHLPDTMVFLSADFKTGPPRVTSRGNKDRLDSESMEFRKLVVQGYELAKDRSRERMHIVDASPDVGTVSNNTVACFIEIIESHV